MNDTTASIVIDGTVFRPEMVAYRGRDRFTGYYFADDGSYLVQWSDGFDAGRTEDGELVNYGFATTPEAALARLDG